MYTASMLLLALFLVCLNGFFVAAEFSFVKVRKTQLELLASSGDKRAQSALFGVTHLDAYLSVCQLGITLASLGLGWLGEPAVAAVLRPLLSVIPVMTPALISSLSIAVGFAAITLLHVVFGELAPKSISIQKAEATVLLLARPMRAMYIVCLPVVAIMNGISNAVLRLVGLPPASESHETHSAEELRMLVFDSSSRGEMDRDEGRLLDNIFSFYHKTAKDIMLHRTDVMAFELNTAVNALLAEAYESGHTRFPVYEESRDNIIGFIHIRDVFRHRGMLNLRDILREPFFAHEALSLDRLLGQMQKSRKQFCIIIDEYGSWQGILTMEDILESIVGNIQDEFDNEEPDITVLADGSFSISGDVSLDELAEHTPLSCTDNDVDMYRIIASHIIDRLGRIPEEGDTVVLCDRKLTVTSMQRNRIKRIKVEEALPGEGQES